MSTDSVKFPEVSVQLTGRDGNAMSIIGAVRLAMRRAGVPEEDVKYYTDEAMSGDYDNVLRVSMRTVNVT